MKTISLAFAALVTAALFGVTGAPANASGEPAFKLSPATAMTKADTLVVNDVLWKCSPNGCIASTANSRPAVVCAQAARKIGKIASFSFKGAEFDEAALASCNAKAKA